MPAGLALPAFRRSKPMDGTHRLLRLQIVVIWRVRVKIILVK
jgi:hypothetical protein